MNIDERRQCIIAHLMEENIVSVNSLITMLNESPATIRRDLTFLEENGYISRTHGYAKYIPPAIVQSIEISEGKIRVAKAAAAMIPDGQTVFLDSGVSSRALAMQLVNRDDICVYTNSLSVANVLASTNVSTNLTCGYLEGRQEALVGPDAEAYVRQLRFPMLFLTTTGIRPDQGLACITAEQANIKRALIESSEQVILLTEVKKFSIDSVRLFAAFNQIDKVIVDGPIQNSAMEETLKRNHVELVIA